VHDFVQTTVFGTGQEQRGGLKLGQFIQQQADRQLAQSGSQDKKAITGELKRQQA